MGTDGFDEADAEGCLTASGKNSLKCNSKDGNDLTISGAYAAVGGEQCYFCETGTSQEGTLEIGIINDTGSTRPSAGVIGTLQGLSAVGSTCPIARCTDNEGSNDALGPGNIIFDAGSIDFTCGDSLAFDAGDFVLFWTDAGANSNCASFDECKDFSPKCKVADSQVVVGTGISCKDLPDRTRACELPEAYTDVTAVFNIPPNDACGELTMTSTEGEGPAPCDGTPVTRTYTLTTGSGVTGTCTEDVAIVDNPPGSTPFKGGSEFVLDSVNVQCASDEPSAETDLTVQDDCAGPLTLTATDTKTGGGCANRYTIERTYSSEADTCGQTTSIVQMINVYDSVKPVIESCPVQADYSCNAADISLSDAPTSITDNCFDPADSVPACFGSVNTLSSGTAYITHTWTADDGCNDPVVCTQQISIDDCSQGQCA